MLVVENKPQRDEHGRYLPGHKCEGTPWQPGQSGNPKGGKSLKQELRKVLLEVMSSEDGKVQMPRIEYLARKVCKWAAEETPSKQYTQRQNVAMKSLLDLFAPAEKLHRHEIAGAVGVTITPAARLMQQRCAEFANANGGVIGAADYRRIRDDLTITDEDLGIENGGDCEL